MVKIVIFLLVSILLYFGLLSLSDYDHMIDIAGLEGYNVQINPLFFILVLTLLLAAIILCSKLLFWLISFPFRLANNIRQQRVVKLNNNIRKATIQLLSGDKNSAITSLLQLMPELSDCDPELENLLATLETKDKVSAINNYHKLLSSKNCRTYACQQLAFLYLDTHDYINAEKYALQALDNSSEQLDIPLLRALMTIYNKMGHTDRALKIYEQLSPSIADFTTEEKIYFADQFISFAKELLTKSKDDSALQMLEKALELVPTHLDALHMYENIWVSERRPVQNLLDIIKNAFALRPSFDIAQMLVRNMDSSPSASYKLILSLVPLKQDPALFLAIASHLGLAEEEAKAKDLIRNQYSTKWVK